jgi:hypothetical protein
MMLPLIVGSSCRGINSRAGIVGSWFGAACLRLPHLRRIQLIGPRNRWQCEIALLIHSVPVRQCDGRPPVAAHSLPMAAVQLMSETAGSTPQTTYDTSFMYHTALALDAVSRHPHVRKARRRVQWRPIEHRHPVQFDRRCNPGPPRRVRRPVRPPMSARKTFPANRSSQ